MKTDPHITIKLRVQETLDELLRECLIPFKLTAYKVDADGLGKYVVSFYDSRAPSASFSWDGRSIRLKELIRATVLDQVKRTAAASVVYGSVGYHE